MRCTFCIVGVMLLVASSSAVHAQKTRVSNSSAPSWLTAAVVEFNELGGYKARGLGRRSAEWTYRLLAEAGRWRLVPRPETLEAEQKAGVRPPLEVADLQRLGDALGAQLLVSGVVDRVELDRRRARVTVAVRVEVTETTSGEIVAAANGKATVQGHRERPCPTDELVEEALQEACKRALKPLLSRPVLLGRVLARGEHGQFRIDLTSGQGLRKDRRVLVVRGQGDQRRVVGVALVREVRRDYSLIVGLSHQAQLRLGDLVLAP